MLFWLSVIEALDIRYYGYIDITDNQLQITEFSDVKSMTSLQGDDFLRMFNKCHIIMATSTFQWWIIILFWRFQVENYKYFRIFDIYIFFIILFFLAQIFCSLKKPSLKIFNLSENKRIGVGSCNDTVGMSLWFASWGQTSYFFLDWSFPSFQLPYKFPWALHKHGKTKFLHVSRSSNKYPMATFYLCNVVTL